MQISVQLLKSGYDKSEEFYSDFKANNLRGNEDYFTEKIIVFPSDRPFPIYMGKGNDEEKKREFLKAFDILANHYISSDRNVHFDEVAWHSFLVTHQREYLIEQYPSIMDSQKDFNNIVIKKFDWENYIYKCILAVEYVEDVGKDNDEKSYYYELIVDNLDLYNYIIKYEIFRNGEFLLKILNIVDELDISSLMKAKIKDRPDLGNDERYGRRVIFELNKSYPVIMAPMLSKEELKVAVLRELENYYDVSELSKANISTS